MNPTIPMFDYLAQYGALREDVHAAITRVLESGLLILGPEVEAFEREMVSSLRASEGGHAVGVNSGTDALVIAMTALGVAAGDEVITVANTAVPTVSAIRELGATPVFCDVDERTLLIDLTKIDALITAKTRAVVAVHLFGNMVDIPALRRVVSDRKIALIEDCAQSQGATLRGGAAGTFGDAAAYSFYPTKNLGAYGDGGLAFCRDAATAKLMRSLRMYGFDGQYYAEREGRNSRLDPIQAAILRVKLAHLDHFVARRRELAALYDQLLDSRITRIATTDHVEHGHHLYVVRIANRTAVRAAMTEAGVATGIHYPFPIHLMRGYSFLGYAPGSLPVTERVAEEILSLPMYPELSNDAVARVATALNRVTRSAS